MIVDFRVTVPAGERAVSRQGREADYLANYNRIYTRDRSGTDSVEALLASMDRAGVDRAVLQAEWSHGDYRDLNAAVVRIVRDHPDRLTGFCTVNPAAPDDMVEVVEQAVAEGGMRGVNLQPFAYRLMADDRRFYPLYATCQALGLPVSIHTSVNFSSNRSIEFGRPLTLCQVACDFPALTIIANHGGWPWVTEMVAVAWKHPNVLIEIGGISPKYLGTPGSGWESLMQFGNTLLQDRVLFATDSMIPHERAVQELNQLPLKEEVTRKWLGANAAQLLRRMDEAGAAHQPAPGLQRA